MIKDDIEQEYLSKQIPYLIEKQILESFSKDDLKKFIYDTKHEYLKDKLPYEFNLNRKILKYGNLKELDKFFIEQLEYFFNGGEELEMTEKFLEKLERYYKLHYEKVKHNFYKTIDIKAISIIEIISMYVKIPNSLRKNIKCCFHSDKTASMRIYELTNSRYCFGCQRGGGIVEFISEIEKCSKKEAYKKICTLFPNY